MGRMGCNMTIFFKECNMFTVLSSCLLSPIMVIIECQIIYRDKRRKKLKLGLVAGCGREVIMAVGDTF